MEEDLKPSENLLYQTLSPLSLSPSNHSPISDHLQPTYSVYRNEISLSTLECCASPQSDAPDFFYLDVGSDDLEQVSASTPLRTQILEVEPKRPTPEVEPKFESSWFRGNSKIKSPMLQLHKEIVDFCEFLSPTPEEEAARNEAVESVFGVIKHIWPHCRVEVFGSFKTGLYLPTSDIDVVILGSGLPSPQLGLNALSRALSQRSMAKKIQVIGKARVPIIKFVEKKSGVSFDISFDLENGPKAAEFIQDAVAKVPPLRPLCLILKVFLQQRELNEVYSGGIGSYALLAMLMAMLRNVHECQASPEQNLGVLLVRFFDFYGRKLNTSDVGISCNGEATFFSKSTKGLKDKGRSCIAIEDPQAPDNDIGKSSFNYFQIKSAFSMAFSTLTNPKIILGLGPCGSILGTIIRPDPVLLERKGGSNGEFTFSSLLPGAGEPLEQLPDQRDMLCNWQLELEEEEPLPRSNHCNGDAPEHSSRKKRKASSKDKSGKKVKESRELGLVGCTDNSSSKGKDIKKKRWRHNKVKVPQSV